MDMDFTLYDGHIATVTIPVDDMQMAMGVSLNDGSLATWEIVGGKHQQMQFFSNIDEATENLCIRTLGELRLKKQVQEKEQGRGR